MIKIKVIAQVVPTEDVDKVAKAITTIFPRATLQKQSDKVSANLSLKDLEIFRTLVERQQILDSVRNHARKSKIHVQTRGTLEKDTYAVRLRLNKQAAYAGSINCISELDIDPIKVITLSIKNIEDVESFLDIYFPRWESLQEDRNELRKKAKLWRKQEEKSRESNRRKNKRNY